MTNNSIISKIIINNTCDISIPFDIQKYVSRLCLNLSLDVSYLEFTLLTPDSIKKLNKQHFDSNESTDTISFNLTPEEAITGDIYLCPEVIQNNSIKYQTSFEKEFKIVIIHSILHLIGYTDDNEQSSSEMTKKQNNIYQQLINES